MDYNKIQSETEPEMEYCASAAIMLAEEFWQIVEGFVDWLLDIYKSDSWKNGVLWKQFFDDSAVELLNVESTL